MIRLAPKVLSRIVRSKVSRINLSLTYDCNQRCKTCNIWKINRENPSLKDQEMKLYEIERIFDMNRDILWVSLTGGEPFLRQDIDRILRRACSSVNIVNITTNGSLSNKVERGVIETLKINKRFSLIVSISLNGNREIHNAISGVEHSYEKAMETYARLLNINDRRLRINLEYTISKHNLGQLKYIDTPNVIISIATNTPYARISGDVDFAVSVKEIKEEIKYLKYDHDVHGIIQELFLQRLTSERSNPKCVAGEYSIFVDPYGKIYNCSYFTGGEIGDLRKSNYKIVLNGDRNKIENCKKCWSSCEAYPTIIFRPWRIL